MGHINFSFPSYNVKGMLSSKKHLKQYFKSKLKPSGLLFFKRSIFDQWFRKKVWLWRWFTLFQCLIYLRVLVASLDNRDSSLKKLFDKKGRILALDAWIDGFDLLLININNELNATLSKNINKHLILYKMQKVVLSQNLQENVTISGVLNTLFTDHSPVFCSISIENEFNKGKEMKNLKNQPNIFLISNKTIIESFRKETCNQTKINDEAKMFYKEIY